MKLSVASAALVITYCTAVSAAPTAEYNAGAELALSKRDVDLLNDVIANLESYNKVRDNLSSRELAKRDYPVVTDVLTAIAQSGLGPLIIQYFIDDPNLSLVATEAIVAAVKSGIVNLTTLLTGLNDSGLADQVITTLINDCDFYSEIYKLALNAISNLVNKVFHNAPIPNSSKREAELPVFATFEKRDNSQTIVTNLMDSLKKSGLADQVVKALVVDDNFYTWGGDLISKLFSSGAITLPQIIDAVISSGLVPNLIKEFLNFSTFQTVITNALKAAAGQCNATTLSSISQTTTQSPSATSPATNPTPTSTPGPKPSNCKKRRKRRSY